MRGSHADPRIPSYNHDPNRLPESVFDHLLCSHGAGKYLEIFARKNNLRNFWVSVGNEVTGTGPPKEDMACIEAQQAPQGAVYGAAAPKGK